MGDHVARVQHFLVSEDGLTVVECAIGLALVVVVYQCFETAASELG